MNHSRPQRRLSRNVLLPALVLPVLSGAQAQAPAMSAPAMSAPAMSAPAPSWKPVPLFPASSIKVATLPNAVRVLTRATQGSGLVCVQVWVRAGSRFESLAESGAAHIVEAASMRASRGFPRAPGALDGGAARAIEALGGQVNSQTSRDSTFFTATVAAPFLPQALKALSDAALRPDLSDAAIEEARAGALIEQQDREGNPLSAVSDLAYHAAFARHPYSKPAGGSSLNIETLAPARVRAYHKKMYVGRALSVVMVGDFNAATAQKLAAQAFAAAPAAAAQAAPIPPEAAPRAFTSIVRKRPINRSALALAFAAPPVSKAEDSVAMDVLLALWREGSQAALRRSLLSPRGQNDPNPKAAPPAQDPNADPDPDADSGDGAESAEPPLALAYDVDYLTQHDASLFVVTMAIEPGDQAEAVEAVLAEVGRVQDGGVGEDELRRAKNLLAEQFSAQSEGVSGQAASLGFYDAIGSYEFALKYLPRVARVTRADLQRVAKTYFSRTKYLQATIEPLPSERTPERNSPTIVAQSPSAKPLPDSS